VHRQVPRHPVLWDAYLITKTTGRKRGRCGRCPSVYHGIPRFIPIYGQWNGETICETDEEETTVFRKSLAWVTTVRSSCFFFWDSLAARVWSQYKFINSSSMFNMRCFSMLHHFSPATFGRKVTVKSPPQGERQQRGSSRPSLVVWLTGEGMAE